MTHILIKYLKYLFIAKHRHGFGIHSPFAFDLVTNIIEDRFMYPEYKEMDSHRNELLHNKEIIDDGTFGAESKTHPNGPTKIAPLVRRSSVSKKNGELLFRLSRHFKPATMLELGTSIGLSSLYLSKGNPAGTLYTIEGNENKIRLAEKNHKSWNCNNIKYLNGKFDDVLPDLLEHLQVLDFVFFDGNHRKAPTLHYFGLCLKLIDEKSVFIFDDIHWSREMEETWQAIKQYKEVIVTFDLFNMGLVFFGKGLQKQDYILKF
jgi:predicted O-methyltransferase YrrM